MFKMRTCFFLQISYRLQVINVNVSSKHNICKCSLEMFINFERGRKTNNMSIPSHEAKIATESKYELNKRDMFHSACKWENHPIKTSQTLYHERANEKSKWEKQLQPYQNPIKTSLTLYHDEREPSNRAIYLGNAPLSAALLISLSFPNHLVKKVWWQNW